MGPHEATSMPPVSRPPVKRTRPALASMSALGEVLMKLYSRDLDRVKFVTGDLEIRACAPAPRGTIR